MRKIFYIAVLIISIGSYGQEGVKVGLNVSPGFKVNMSKQKGTGLRNNNTGYGFNVGLPVKVWVSEFTALNTGVNYDFAAFDSYFDGLLISSFRVSAIDVPVLFNIHMSGQYYGLLGGGVAYNLRVADLNAALGTNLTGVSNRIQPYLSVGINNLMEKDFGLLEIGILGRYQLLDIWKSSYQPYENISSHLVSLDLLFRYYF
ncbi:outer membrane beta-barrel protein [Crocinitomix algicola]|uniref:outer membrane beta-barrel protein n=1 Tax=Crocinitomix algicola TaxID=1740263 RepID=UPI0008721EEA|nr:outer membrane beta-barrel protein [Crocinitomix algicola]